MKTLQLSHSRQCNDPIRVKQHEKCYDNFKTVLKQCLSSSETKAFSRIEDTFLRLNQAICSMDDEDMKRT